MTLQASGPITFSDIRIELTGTGSTTMGLRLAEQGTYGTINKCSVFKPDGTGAATVSEWYQYNHLATSSILFIAGEGPEASPGQACTQSVSADANVYFVGSTYYSQVSCSTVVANGSYANNGQTSWYTFTDGGLDASGACSSLTTTTTTTTTTIAGTCYQATNPGGGTSNTINWQSIDGINRNGTLAAGGTASLCSLTVVAESPAVNVQVLTGGSCTELCTTIACKQQCTYP